MKRLLRALEHPALQVTLAALAGLGFLAPLANAERPMTTLLLEYGAWAGVIALLGLVAAAGDRDDED